ncbi:hypothetical protein AB0H71_18980 [Nocardia sp. NPDC050697]|uniref:hypothetical protein n=1 Tax=Nocardia sp. NPDC050697 TaxID=3155158 RepID=UPI0033C65618
MLALEHGPVVVEVVEVGITAPALHGDPFVGCGDGSRHRLPESLHDWAIAAIARTQNSDNSPFPRRVEFGMREGRAYARLL